MNLDLIRTIFDDLGLNRHCRPDLDLPDKVNPRKRRQSGRGRKKTGARNLDSSASESPMKRRCVVQDDFTDSEVECVGAAARASGSDEESEEYD